MTRATLSLLAAAALAAASPAAAQRPMGRPGTMPAGELKLVSRFDRDGDRRLDSLERRAARDSLPTTRGARGGMGRGGPGGPGGPGGRGGFATPEPGARLTPRDVPAYPNAPLYDASVVRTIFLDFPSADWEQELADFNDTDVDVPARVTVDGKTYRDVGVHFRGMSSYFMVPAGLKRSLNLSFDHAVPGQSLGGHRTLNLLNAANDPTFVRAMLYSHVASRFLPTPRTNYVRVVVNGESWGIYVSAEQFNTDFVREHFGTTAGARWKVPGSPGGRGGMEYLGEDLARYRRTYDIRSADTEKPWRDLVAMFRVLNETPPERLERELAPRLDVDGVLRFLALEVAMVNSDGYWARASDYSIYQDTTGRFHVVPHDINEAFGGEGGGPGPMGGGATLDPLVGVDDATKPLRSKLLAVPALRERYLGYVREIAERSLDWKTLGPVAERYRALIAADVARDTRKLYPTDRFASGLTEGEGSLRAFVERRRAYLLGR